MEKNPNASILRFNSLPKTFVSGVSVKTVDGQTKGTFTIKKLGKEIYILPGRHEIECFCEYTRWYTKYMQHTHFRYEVFIECGKTYQLDYDWKLKRVTKFEEIDFSEKESVQG